MEALDALGGLQTGFPVRNRIFARAINGVTTNFVWNMYLDHLLLIITQIGTVGTVFSARCEGMCARQRSGAFPSPYPEP